MTTSGQAERLEGSGRFFGLNEAPFSLAPEPRFLFASASHSAALAQVADALEMGEPLVVITSEIGTGKTLLCRTVLQGLRPKTFLSVISNPLFEGDDLLKQLLQDFGVISKDWTRLAGASRQQLIQTLHAFLRSLAPIHANAVVIIDEAQRLQPDVLEQIRLVSTIDDDPGGLLQIILVGQTDLETLLSRPELRQLQQRVSRRVTLTPLKGDEVPQYIEHRLALARERKQPSAAAGATGLERELAEWEGTNAGVEFTPDAIQAVSQLSGGVPRTIHLLCDRSLEDAYASRLRVIDGPLIQTAARALGLGGQAAPVATAADAKATAPSIQPEPNESFWSASRSGDAPGNTIQPADKPVPAALAARPRPAAAPSLTKYLVAATSLALAAVAVWFGLRATRLQVAEAPPLAPLAAAPASSAPRGTSARREPAPEAANASAPGKAPTIGTPIPPAATAPDRPAGAATATGGPFDIVVASFRTDVRASSVAAEVVALGLPVRRRISDGWQQVLSGPFASRPDAEAAQARLHRAGLTGTQIVPTAR